MKKAITNSYVALIVICIFLAGIKVNCQTLPIILPCYTDYTNQNPPPDCDVPWDGPKYLTICSNSLQYVYLDCYNPPPPNCCFEFEYYDREVICPPSTTFYDVQIVAQQTTPLECWDCFESQKDHIVKELLWRKFEEHRELFRNDWGQCSETDHLVTIGSCFRTTGNPPYIIPCSDRYCCASWLQVCFDADGHVNSVTQFPTEPDPQMKSLYPPGTSGTGNCATMPINCPGGFIKCDLNILDPNCDIPCDFGPWIEGTEYNIPFHPESCPDCQVTIHYEYRQNDQCIPPYKDYKIKRIDHTPSCSTCTYWTDEQLFYFALNYLFNNGPLPLPQQLGECQDYFRSIMSPCWRENFYSFIPCEYENCCWSRYRVCNIGGGNFTKQKIDGSQYSQSCLDPECRVICTDFPYKKPEIEKVDSPSKKGISLLDCKTYSYPNPATSSVSVSLIADYQGQIKFELFNILGESLIKKELFKEKQDLVFSLDVLDLSPGTYYYHFYIGDNPICKGSVNINK